MNEQLSDEPLSISVNATEAAPLASKYTSYVATTLAVGAMLSAISTSLVTVVVLPASSSEVIEMVCVTPTSSQSNVYV